ncbi:hypothetical protein [Aliivibrio sp. SR45-2]|jgi:hypothetical protein|uniref:hypothetical protein n=1 Tax=Aliivibrio TaxID=511678 RepID=UPI0015FD1AAE|nr:hypothetical protein [Aliivibrio sp. SR45-2]MBB1315412.1 hypothetical protein [Aliivibrio sp. SR45-2]
MCKQTNYSKYQKRVIKFLNDLLGTDTPFSYERAKNNHLKVLIDGVPKPIYTGSTPSDCKSINNFMAEVKRELKASKLEPEEVIKPTKVKLTDFIKQSNDKLIQSSVKSLRTRITTLKLQEETLVLDTKNIESVSTKRTEVVKHAISYALQARKQGAYIKAKEMNEIEKTVITHLNFMLPSMAYYAELLDGKTKYQMKQEVQTSKLAPLEENTSCNNVVQLEGKAAKELIQDSAPMAKTETTQQPVSSMMKTTSTSSDSATDLMAMSANNRVNLLRNLTKAQALMLIDDINQAMAQNREEDIQAVVNLIRDKELPLEVIISRMEAA